MDQGAGPPSSRRGGVVDGRVRGVSVGTILFLVAAVQFVNIVDFMIVMPLGPDFAAALGVPTSHLGYVGGAYTASASVAGLVAAFVLDRFDRRSALAVCMAGLMVGTALGGFAHGLGSLLFARVVAGAFGGPATSVSLSIVSDVVPPEHRGRALGAVMGAFSAASVLGVPGGLELARIGGWRLPFFAVAGLGAAITIGATFFLPPLSDHIERVRRSRYSVAQLLRDPLVLLSLVVIGGVAMSAFLVIPNFSAYFQFNTGYPRARLGILYLVGGVVSFFAMRVVGRLVDRLGAVAVMIGGTLGFWALLYADVVLGPPLRVPAMLFFVLFMIFQPSRAVPGNSVGTRVPPPEGRAMYQSIQSSVQHLACAAGAILSSRMLSENPDHSLVHMDRTAWLSMAIALLPLLAMWLLEPRVRAREPDKKTS